MVAFVDKRLALSPRTIFGENLYKILKILHKFNCLVNFKSNTKRLTQQTARQAVSKGLGRRLKNNGGKEFFKKLIFWKMSTPIYRLGF